jgi:hypothetical protein
MEKTVIYRGVSGTEAVIVKGLGPEELGERWTTNQEAAQMFATWRGGGVFRMAVDPSRCIVTRNSHPDRFKVKTEELSPEDLGTLEYRRPGDPHFRKVWEK